MRKAQVSLEFIVASGMALLFLLGLVIVIGNQRTAVLDKEAELQGRIDCIALATAITGVFSNPGSAVNVILTGNATVQAGSRVITTPSYACTIPIDAVTDGTSRTFFIDKGNVTVHYENDAVVVANA